MNVATRPSYGLRYGWLVGCGDGKVANDRRGSATGRSEEGPVSETGDDPYTLNLSNGANLGTSGCGTGSERCPARPIRRCARK